MERAIALSAGWARPWASSSVATSDSRPKRSVPPDLGVWALVGAAEVAAAPTAVDDEVFDELELPLHACAATAAATATTTRPTRRRLMFPPVLPCHSVRL